MSAKLGKYRTLCCTALLFAFLIAVRITFIHLTLSSADVTIENSSAIMSIMSTSERKGRKVAVVYARPTFHEEVVNAVTCTLHDLGYFTVVYIGSGIHLNGFAIPYLYQDRLDDSSSFYGNCVDKWIVVPISGPIFKSNGSSRRQPTAVENIPMDTSLIVFTTFPMMVNINTFDIFNKFKHIDNTSSQPILTDTYAMSIIQFMRDHATATNAIFIVHRVTDIFNSSQSSYISTMLGEDRSTFRFVSKHTRDTFLLMCRTKNDYKSNHICNCASDYFYPLPSLKMKLNMNENVDYDPMTKGNNNNNNNNDNNNNIINNNNNNKCTSKDSTRKATISFAVQGRFGGKYADRRDPQSVISCLQKIEKSTKSTINVSITFIGNNFFDQKSRGQFGHLQSGDVRYISRLKYDDYYRAIAFARFIMPGLSNVSYHQYSTLKATSTVPIALAVGVPLVSTSAFLDVYPCLRDAPIHRRVSGQTECDSAMNAATMSHGDYILMRRETAECAELYRENAKNLFN